MLIPATGRACVRVGLRPATLSSAAREPAWRPDAGEEIRVKKAPAGRLIDSIGWYGRPVNRTGACATHEYAPDMGVRGWVE